MRVWLGVLGLIGGVLSVGVAPAAVLAQFDEDAEDEGLGSDEGFAEEGAEEAGSADQEDAGDAGDDAWTDGDADVSGGDGGGGMALSFGLKLGGGGNLLPTPDNTPAVTAPFDDGAGGYAFTVGPFAELRLMDGLLGFQTGLIFDFVTNLSEISTPAGDQTWGWSGMDLRIPILAQLGTTGEGTRLYVTTGPEIVAGLSGEAVSDVPVPPGLDVSTVTRANWLVGLGLASPLGPVRLSFDIQFAYNFGVPSDYFDRVGATGLLQPSVEAQHAMDLRLLLAAAYNLDL